MDSEELMQVLRFIMANGICADDLVTKRTYLRTAYNEFEKKAKPASQPTSPHSLDGFPVRVFGLLCDSL